MSTNLLTLSRSSKAWSIGLWAVQVLVAWGRLSTAPIAPRK